MKRNFDKYAEAGAAACRRNKADDLTITEVAELMKRARGSETDALINTIAAAYYAGYTAGQRRGTL